MPIPLSAVGASILPNVGCWASGFLVRKHYKSWFMLRKKPSWSPPLYAYCPLWTAVYSGMGFASYIVWKEGGGFQGKAGFPLAVYAVQLALNWAWPPLFFSENSFKWCLIDGGLLALTAGSCSVLFHNVDKTAGLLMIPYLAWLGLASSLSFALCKPSDKK